MIDISSPEDASKMSIKPYHPTNLTCKILMFLAGNNGTWCTWGQGFYMPSVQQVFPVGTSEMDQLKYMQNLQNEGLVSGCNCGCRGDYTPTEKGLEFLASDSVKGEQERKRYYKEVNTFGY